MITMCLISEEVNGVNTHRNGLDFLKQSMRFAFFPPDVCELKTFPSPKQCYNF